MTFDPTQNRVPCGPLMTDEELATLKAWPHGWRVWNNAEKKWQDTNHPYWVGGSIYRAKPAPVVTSRWFNVYPIGTGYASGSRMDIDTNAARNGRIGVLRIDTCNGVSTAHLEPLEGGEV